MSDEFDQLADRIAAELRTVHWAEPAQLRAVARRRTLRTVLAAPVLVLLLTAGVWTVLAGELGTAKPDVAASRHTPIPATGPSTATPSPSATATPSGRTEVSPTPAVDLRVPSAALLQAEDVGPGAVLTNEVGTQPGWQGWTFGDDSCPAYAGLRITAPGKYQHMLSHTLETGDPSDADTDRVHVETRRYASTATARQVLADARRFVRACAAYESSTEADSPLRPAHAEVSWRLLAEGFAGDEAVLVRQRRISVLNATGESTGNDLAVTYAMVRVGSMVSVVFVEKDQAQRIEGLAGKAAARLCAATGRCGGRGSMSDSGRAGAHPHRRLS